MPLNWQLLTWNMPKIVELMESLTREQDKLVIMGTIKPSNDQDLVAGDSKVDSKSKKKAKNTPERNREAKFEEESSGSKKNPQKKKNKGEMSKCAYYSKGYHPESYCMKK